MQSGEEKVTKGLKGTARRGQPATSRPQRRPPLPTVSKIVSNATDRRGVRVGPPGKSSSLYVTIQFWGTDKDSSGRHVTSGLACIFTGFFFVFLVCLVFFNQQVERPDQAVSSNTQKQVLETHKFKSRCQIEPVFSGNPMDALLHRQQSPPKGPV